MSPLGASGPSNDLSLDGDGLAPGWGSQPDPVAALYPVSRGAGPKQTTPLESLVAQQSSERPPTLQVVDSDRISGLERGLCVPELGHLTVLG